MISIEDFCKLHDACQDGFDWALADCKTMADVWATARPEWLVWVATRPGVLDDRTLRLFAVDCARSVEHLLTDQRSRDAIDVAERHTKGLASDEELAAASAAAWDARAAAWDAASAASSAAASAAAWAAEDAAWDAARAVSWAAARAAAWDAARDQRDAAWDAARAVSWAAARAAAWDAARDQRAASSAAARERQATWLRENASPNFAELMGGE